MVSIDTPATGNCLFEAIIQLVNQFTNNNDLTATELRNLSVDNWVSNIRTVDTFLAQLPEFENIGYQVFLNNIDKNTFLVGKYYENLEKEIGQKEKTIDWFFAGQINHPTRDQCAYNLESERA